ncbi:MAG TPA: hypothetical protein VNP04_13575 [Alphaproteobacteria bacterium]|nr:hypothetical protein [Alphaproteobacteria bacterium]
MPNGDLSPWDEGDERDWFVVPPEPDQPGQVLGDEAEAFYLLADMIMAQMEMGWMVAVVFPVLECGCQNAWICGDPFVGFQIMGCQIHDRSKLIFTNN